MNNRLQFRAWCEVPLKDDNGKEKVYGFYLYEINVYDGGKEIGFDENILSDNLSLYDFPDTVLGELLDHFVMNNCIISDNYYRYWKSKSIEQCTGIKDESGNLIYEGDIVKFSFIDEVDFGNFGAKSRIKYIGKGKIIFESGCFVLINLKTNYKIPCFDDKLQFIKIIGNVRETPELLEGK